MAPSVMHAGAGRGGGQSTTTLSTIAIKAGEHSRIVLAVLKVGHRMNTKTNLV
jgi:hypothetical protein